jgi:uncharacterized membrane protein
MGALGITTVWPHHRAMTEYAIEDYDDEHRTLPAAVYGLYLLGLSNGLTVLVGLAIAYTYKGRAGPRMQSHYVFQIRTFWTAIGWWIVGGALIFWGIPLIIVGVGVLMIILGGLIFAAGHIWFALRCILGSLYLVRGEAYPRPHTWLV